MLVTILAILFATIWLYFYFVWQNADLGFHVLWGVALAAMLPQFLSWLPLTRRSGRLLVDLGRMVDKRTLVLFAFFVMNLVREVGALLAALHAGTATVGHWLGPAAFTLVLLWGLLMWRRGLSVHESGVLTPECLIEWLEILSWTCDRTTASLSIGVRGAGLIRSLVAPKPMADTVKTWRIPPARVDAVKDILAQRAPVPETAA